jgi:RimJ/RimL family protein N-acetyltransferase
MHVRQDPVADPINIEVAQVPLDAILSLREQYRRAMNCQIVHDSYHARGFTHSYLLRLEGQVVGYGSVAGDPRGPKEIIKEFHVLPACRTAALPLFRALIAASRARWIEAQTNDTLLTLMLFDCAVDLVSDRILFADGCTTNHAPPGVVLRPVTDQDRANIFPHTTEPVGEWGLQLGPEVVATGGLMFHYNPPYGDIYMEVAAPFRRRGYGSYLVQELKRLCYGMGRTPAARCNKDNLASRLTLQRAGMLPCAHIVRGRIAA